MRPFAWMLMGALAISSCDGDEEEENSVPGEKIDCSWFVGQNCYKDLLTTIATCVEPEATHGTLAADGASCTYANGANVTFSNPVTLPVPDDYTWDFDTKTATSTACVDFLETEDGLVITGPGGTFVQEAAGFTMVMTCPDGSQYNIGAFDAMECDWMSLPGHSWSTWSSGGSTSLSFSLVGGGEDEPQLWSCLR